MTVGAQIVSSVNSILPTLFGDPYLVTPVTWKRFSESWFDEVEGVNNDIYVDYKNISAIRIDKDISVSKFIQNRLSASQMGMAVGDNAYLFQAADVPARASIRDIVIETETGIKYSVKKINPVFGLIVKVEVKGYA